MWIPPDRPNTETLAEIFANRLANSGSPSLFRLVMIGRYQSGKTTATLRWHQNWFLGRDEYGKPCTNLHFFQISEKQNQSEKNKKENRCKTIFFPALFVSSCPAFWLRFDVTNLFFSRSNNYRCLQENNHTLWYQHHHRNRRRIY